MKKLSVPERLAAYFKAAYPAIALETHEETRALGDILEAAKAAGKNVSTWSVTEGVRVVAEKGEMLASPTELGGEDLEAALGQRLEGSVLVLRDCQTWPLDRDPRLQRCLRDLLTWAPSAGSCVVLLGSRAPSAPTCEKLVTVLDYGLPDERELRRVADGIGESAGGCLEVSDAVLRALSGLSVAEAENALALSVVETSNGKGGRFDAGILNREKVQAVRRSGLLELIEPDPRGLGAIGGLDVLKAWVRTRARAFGSDAAAFGLPAPRGIEIVGVPGGGKSLAAKCIGTAWEIPTVKMDMGALFQSLVGESERRAREALALAEAIAPCVLWLDEIDKGFAGVGGGGSTDGGVGARVFGTILTWMQERRRPVFVVATANNVTSLPPELLRKGRWDELWAVDLPSVAERRAIFSIHLRARGRDWELDGGELDQSLIAATEGFTGAEIEAVVVDGLYRAFDAGRELAAGDLLEAARATVPLSRTAAEQVEAIRTWAKGRARFASSVPAPVGGSTVRKLA